MGQTFSRLLLEEPRLCLSGDLCSGVLLTRYTSSINFMDYKSALLSKGSKGVEEVLSILKNELEVTMQLAGIA